MKKILGPAATTIALYATQVSLSFAAEDPTKFNPCKIGVDKTQNIICKIDAANPGGVIGSVVSFILFLAIFIAFIFLVIGGLKWMTSGGDKSAIESARNTIIAAIIGLVVAFLAYLIMSLILGFLGLSFETLTLPKIPA